MANPYESALKAGYTEEEIANFLSKSDPNFKKKFDFALEKGYQPDEIIKFASSHKSPKSLVKKGLHGIEKFQRHKDDESLSKTIGRTAYQPVSGYLKAFTYPADILQLAGLGEALDPEFIDRLKEIHEREGIPFDENKYRAKVAEASAAFPTQGNIEKAIEEKTGLPLQAKTGYQKALSLGGSAGGFQAGALAQKGIAGVTAPVVSEIAQTLGIPEPLAEMIGLTKAGGTASGKIAEKVLTPEQQALRQIAGKHELPTYAGMEVEKAPKINPVVSKGKQEKLTQQLSKASENAIDKVISEQLPLNKVEKLGINPETVYERSYQRMEETAKIIDKQIAEGKKRPIDVSPILNWIKKEESKIYASAPSLSSQDKVRLKILKQEANQLTKEPAKSFVPKLKLGAPRARKAKTTNASQIIDQTRNYNENRKGIYRKPEFSGSENEVIEVYGQLNEQFHKLLEASGEKDLARQFWFGNQVFHETSKVNHVKNIISPALEEGYSASRMAKVLKSKSNKKFLERNLGKNAVKDLIDIAHYGKQAEKLVFDRLKNPATVGEYLSNLTPMKAGLLLMKHGATAGLGTVFEIGKGTSQRIAGTLFTRPGTRKAYVNFLKGAMSSKKSVLDKASIELTKAIEEEFGSEENLFKIATEKEA